MQYKFNLPVGDVLSMNAFQALWVTSAPGEAIRYYRTARSSLASDRLSDPRVGRIAVMTMTLAEDGKAILFQKRQDGELHYFIKKTCQ